MNGLMKIESIDLNRCLKIGCLIFKHRGHTCVKGRKCVRGLSFKKCVRLEDTDAQRTIPPSEKNSIASALPSLKNLGRNIIPTREHIGI